MPEDTDRLAFYTCQFCRHPLRPGLLTEHRDCHAAASVEATPPAPFGMRLGEGRACRCAACREERASDTGANAVARLARLNCPEVCP